MMIYRLPNVDDIPERHGGPVPLKLLLRGFNPDAFASQAEGERVMTVLPAFIKQQVFEPACPPLGVPPAAPPAARPPPGRNTPRASGHPGIHHLHELLGVRESYGRPGERDSATIKTTVDASSEP